MKLSKNYFVFLTYRSRILRGPHIVCFPLFRLIPESPRWLLSQNKIEDTMVILRRIAKTNGVDEPEDLASDLVVSVSCCFR